MVFYWIWSFFAAKTEDSEPLVERNHLDDVPTHFVCPITHEIMEYPFTTEAGHSYEYSAIKEWLTENNTDPKTRQVLPSKRLIPNHSLRSHILAWFEENPEYQSFRNKDFEAPPREAYHLRPAGLDQIILYRSKTKKSSQKNEKQKGKDEIPPVKPKESTLPGPLNAFGHFYTFAIGQNQKVIMQCDYQRSITMPDRCVFPTQSGFMFYDPKEIRDIWLLPGTEQIDPCKYGSRCTRQDCHKPHPFVCFEGVQCPRKSSGCKFLHPGLESVTNSGKPCWRQTSCNVANCSHAHPKGRMNVKRERAEIQVTYSHSLEKLLNPVTLKITFPKRATRFQVQGEFAFAFQPFPGPWARSHFKVVTVYRFMPQQSAYKEIGNYSLDGHYCNCAVAAGRYLIFSFWPYEEEAMHTIWDCLKVTNALEKQLRIRTKERDAAIRERDTAIKERDAAIRQYKHAQERIAQSRKKAQENEEYWRQMLQRQEAERNERLRLQDPIHIYALQDGKSGFHSGDWKLILDYHKGAHDIELGQLRPDGTQPVQFRVHNTMLHFDLVTPKDLNSLNFQLPLRPSSLCPDF